MSKRALLSLFNKKDMKAFNEADGVDLATDDLVVGLASATVALEARIAAHRSDTKKCKRPEMWDLNPVVFKAFEKTRE